MRLTSEQHDLILRAARRAFGGDVSVRLFGSRVFDHRRGGDFDLYIETAIDDPDTLIAAREAFLCELDKSPHLEGEKVDVVLCSPLHHQPRAIDRVARSEGVSL